MANKKINDLTLRSSFDDTCNLPADDASQTWRVTGAQMKAAIKTAIAPITTLGDILTGGVAGAPTAFAGNTSATKKWLSQTGTGTVSAAPVWDDLPTVVDPNATYFSGYTVAGASWNTTSTTYADGTNSGGNTLTSRVSSNMTVTAAGSNVAGITFTPSSVTAVYLIRAAFTMGNVTSGKLTSVRMYDGTTELCTNNCQSDGTIWAPTSLQGIYAPGSVSAQTVKLQIKVDANTGYIRDIYGTVPSIEWTIIKIVP